MLILLSSFGPRLGSNKSSQFRNNSRTQTQLSHCLQQHLAAGEGNEIADPGISLTERSACVEEKNSISSSSDMKCSSHHLLGA